MFESLVIMLLARHLYLSPQCQDVIQLDVLLVLVTCLNLCSLLLKLLYYMCLHTWSALNGGQVCFLLLNPSF